MDQLFPWGNGELPTLASLLKRPRFEVLPLPKVLEETAALPHNSIVTVTASPSRGISGTIEICEQIAAQGMSPIPHLAARQISDTAELREALDRIDDAGIEEVFVVGGDAGDPAGPFTDGLSLLRAMADLGRLPARIGVPSYPEGHPLIDESTLWSALQEKQAYAHYTVTQMCFDADVVSRFAVAARDRGITLPIVAGVPGVVDATKLLKIGLRIGVGESIRFARGNRSVTGRLLSRGRSRPDSLLRDLGAQVQQGRCELAGLHIYTFNRVAATAQWVDETHHRVA